MDNILLNSSELDKSFIQFENNSSSGLFLGLNNSKLEQDTSSFYSSKKTNDSSDDSTQDDSIKYSLNSNIDYKIHKDNLRKDIYGNIIKKGGKHKVSFKDNLKGKKLVEMTLIDVKQSSIKGKNFKKYTVCLEAKDKRDAFNSSTCNIF